MIKVNNYKLSEEECSSLKLIFLSHELAEQCHEYDLVKLFKKQETRLKAEFSALYEFFNKSFCLGEDCALLKISGFPAVSNKFSSSICCIIGSLFGQIVPEYDGGVYIKNIKVEKKLNDALGRPSARDTRKFMHHTDLSYIDLPPRFFLFFCINNKNILGGENIVTDIFGIEKCLQPEVIEELMKEQFIFPTPEYCHKNDAVYSSVLYQDSKAQLSIRYRRDGIKSLTRQGMIALNKLYQYCKSKEIRVSAEPNTMMIFDNTKCLHGRTGFVEDVENRRHMKQVYFSTEF